MNKQTLKFLFWVVIVYFAILLLTRGFVSADSTPAVSITAIPLIIMAFILIRDLTSRSVQPGSSKQIVPSKSRIDNSLEFLTHQLDAASHASDSYFVDVILTRIREILVTRASLETGVEPETVREILSDSSRGPNFLRNPTLYDLLYSKASRIGKPRIDLIKETVELIENWKA